MKNPETPRAEAATTVLVVDDDDRFRERLSLSLQKRGFEVWSAGHPSEARSQVERHAPEWLVLDLKMPGTSGLDLLRELLELEPATRVVVLTAYGSIATALEAVRRGAHDFLQKPADTDEIIHAFLREPGDERPTPPLEVPSLARAEWEHISRVMEESGGSIRAAARMLGMHRRTLQRKLAKFPSSR
ncbi:MAG: response regulator [Myxococcota bacterium]